MNVELFAQWASAYSEDRGFGYATQLVARSSWVFSALDVYFQLGSHQQTHHYGLGVELGLAPALYGVYSYYPQEKMYVSFTPRVQFLSLENDNEVASRFTLFQQVSVGWIFDSGIDVAAFVAYAHIPGGGYSLRELEDYQRRSDFILSGVSARF